MEQKRNFFSCNVCGHVIQWSSFAKKLRKSNPLFKSDDKMRCKTITKLVKNSGSEFHNNLLSGIRLFYLSAQAQSRPKLVC